MKTVLIILFSILSFQVFAQDNWEQEGEIQDVKVIIEKDRKIVLGEAERNFEKIPPLPVGYQPEKLSYQLKEYNYPLQTLNPKIRLQTVKAEKLKKLYGNYIKAGFGNYITPYVEGYFHNKRNRNYSYGLHVKHLSSINGPVDKANSGTSENKADLNARYFMDKATISANTWYQRNKYYFYGYEEGTEVDRDSIRQVFNTFGIKVAIENDRKEDRINYRLAPSYSWIGDRYEARESQFGLDLKGSYRLQDFLRIQLTGDLVLSKRKDSSTISRNLFRIRPALLFRPNEKLSFDAGLRLVYENDTLSNLGKLHLYPSVLINYLVNKELKLYVGIDGNVQQTSLAGFVAENPYLAPDVKLSHTNQMYKASGGIQGKIARYMSFHAGLSFGSYQNMYFFVNSTEDSSKFDIIYDKGNSTLLQFFGELGYSPAELFRVSFRGDYFNYNMATLEAAWHRPQYKLSLLGNYNLYKKFYFTADFYVLGGIKALSPTTGETVSLKAIPDLNLKIEYLFSPRFSAFLSLNNVLSQKYQRYLNYPSRGFQVMVGLSYQF